MRDKPTKKRVSLHAYFKKNLVGKCGEFCLMFCVFLFCVFLYVFSFIIFLYFSLFSLCMLVLFSYLNLKKSKKEDKAQAQSRQYLLLIQKEQQG